MFIELGINESDETCDDMDLEVQEIETSEYNPDNKDLCFDLYISQNYLSAVLYSRS